MHKSNLRKVGGSIMIAVPPAILQILQLEVGAAVNLSVEAGRLVIEPTRKKHYSLKELLAQCDSSAPISQEDNDWITSGPVGKELL